MLKRHAILGEEEEGARRGQGGGKEGARRRQGGGADQVTSFEKNDVTGTLAYWLFEPIN